MLRRTRTNITLPNELWYSSIVCTCYEGRVDTRTKPARTDWCTRVHENTSPDGGSSAGTE